MTEEEIKTLNDKRDWLLKATSTLYDKSASYTNLVMAAGYAAYFAMWSNTVGIAIIRTNGQAMAKRAFNVCSLIWWACNKASNSLNGAKATLARFLLFRPIRTIFATSQKINTINEMSISMAEVLARQCDINETVFDHIAK